VGGWVSAEKLEEALSEIASYKLPTTSKGAVDKKWAAAVDADRRRAQAQDWYSFVAQGIAGKVASGEKMFSCREIPEELALLYKKIIPHARAVLLSDLARQTSASYEVLSLYQRQYEEQRRLSCTLSFDDVKHKLAEAAIFGDMEHIFYRLDCKIGHLLLDEFQDTSLAEWRVLEPLADEVLSKAERSFFCVGDLKQAIYGWRGGVAEIFDRLEKRWEHLSTTSMELSRRSSPAVISFVNRVFSSLADNLVLENYSDAARVWQQRFRSHETQRVDSTGYVRFEEVQQTEDASAEEALCRRAAWLAQDISQAAPAAKIGILVRRNCVIPRLIQELRQHGIFASDEGGNPLGDSPAVNLILSLFRVADHPGDSIARFHLANSELGTKVGFTDYADDAAAFKVGRELRAEITEVGYGPVVGRLARLILDKSGRRDRRRLEQLISVAYMCSRRGISRLREFVELVANNKVEDPSESRVRVMTVHKAKGLEFDAVIIPELDFKMAGARAVKVMAYREDPTGPPKRVSRGAAKAIVALDERLQAMYDQTLAEEVKEALSLLYVALTRAREALFLLTAPKGKGKDPSFTYADLMRQAIDGSPVIGCIFESGDPHWWLVIKDAGAAGEETESDADIITAPSSLTFISSKAGQRRSIYRTASQLEEEQGVSILELLNDSGGDERSYGLFVHRLCEKISWLDASLPSVDALLGASDMRADDWHCRAAQAFVQAIANPHIAGLFQRTRYGGIGVELFCERSFVIRLDDGSLLAGTFDRLVVGEDSTGKFAEVIDFKTDRLNAGENLESRIGRYTPQLEAYRTAAARIVQAPVDRVRATLAFLSLGEVRTVEFKE
jgi:ATP-dependent exoDNAse (exonuclease V) beta subunit